MHELGVVKHVIDTVEKVAEENNVSQVACVTLEIGEVSTVLPEYLRDCWNWAHPKSEILKDAALKIECIEAVSICEDCGRKYRTVTYAKVCPCCGSENTHLEKGNEFSIKEITVPE